MILLAASAALIGLVHSLAPGHWLPIVLTTRVRKWSAKMSVLGALVAASGHILLSILIAWAGMVVGAHLLIQREEQIEHYSGLGLILFGVVYAIYAYKTHSHCHGHEHHGPKVDKKKAPFLFLFSIGLSPCVAVLPVIIAAAPRGTAHVVATMIGFALGVMGALVGATLLVTHGVKLDHPLLEHYGDVITGMSVALLGALLFLAGGLFS